MTRIRKNTYCQQYTRALMPSLLTALLALLLPVLLAGCGTNSPAPLDARGHNLIKVTTAADFQTGEKEALTVNSEIGNGAVELADDATEGVFTSVEYKVDDFDHMTATWNASEPEGTSVEIMARTRMAGTKEYEDWFSWGVFSLSGRSASCTRDVDEYLVDGTVERVQFRAILRREDGGSPSPVLRQMTFSTKGDSTRIAYEEEALATLPNRVLIPAPAYSQEIRDPLIADSICSPTTVSVMLNSRDPALEVLPEELALPSYDDYYGWGNWAFSTSALGWYGYEAYNQYADRDILLQELAHGRVCGLSCRYTPKANHSTLPRLTGSWGNTPGHLMAVIGYEYADDVIDDNHLYFFAADSYSEADETCYRRYKWTELDPVWYTRILYIAADAPEEGADTTGIRHLNCAVTQESDHVYRLSQAGEDVDLAQFTWDKLRIPGRGTLAYTIEGVEAGPPKKSDHSVVYPEAVRALANQTFFYTGISTDSSGAVTLDAPAALKSAGVPAGETRAITIYAMSNNGATYIGKIEAQAN